jgi:protein-disulfide isomerase
LNEKTYKVMLLALLLVLSGATSLLVTRAQQSGSPPPLSSATRDKVLRYIRQRFGVADDVHLTLSPLRKTYAPDFYEATVTVDDGKKKADQPLLISKDSRFLILGGFIDLTQGTNAEMVQRIREAFKLPESVKLSVGSFHHSASPDFQEGTMTADDGKAKQPRPVLLSKDGKHLILSEIFDLGVDLQQQALHTISLRNAPTQGPANAPVTIVEYADLQCPMCAKMQAFLENQLIPRYGNKVRVVFKEFPLPMHDWSLTAAIGCQCAYELNPASYVPLRSAIFRSQASINITNVRDMVLNYGEQAGADRVKLAACLDAKASWPRVNADHEEGNRVNVVSTPTAFVNGKMIVGLPSAETYFQAVDEALKAPPDVRAEARKAPQKDKK